ncbi:hypothetical protein WJX72_012453 [[Myrmecia] bisecta]|uniref:Cytochrome P450 n=1 Tax=[Myrmecia] bisecta TaxID=41462 RepID=A0AAW1QH75_9CHLO
MELTVANVLLAFVALLAVEVVSVIFHMRERYRLRAFPGPKPAPLLGNLPELRRKTNFIAYADWAKQYGPQFRIFLGHQPVVVLADPELVREVGIKKFKAFHDRSIAPLNPEGGKQKLAGDAGILPSRGAYWTTLRAAMQPLFHTSSLVSYDPIMNQALDTLLANLEAPAASGEPVDMWNQLGRMTMQVLGTAAFGVPFNTQVAVGEEDSELVKASNAVFTMGFARLRTMVMLTLPRALWPLGSLLTSKLGGQQGRKIRQASITVWRTSSALVQNARKRAAEEGEVIAAAQEDWKWWDESTAHAFKDVMPARNSIIDMMMRAKDKLTGAGLTDRQIAANCNTLILAGHETTANTLTFTIFLVARHPDVERKLLAEIDAFGDRQPGLEDLDKHFPYAEAVIKESMRMYPAVVQTGRTAEEDSMVGGRLIPKGTWVHFAIYSIHHNPAYWPQPAVFRPERFLCQAECANRHPNAFLPFGLGPRMCIGWRMADQEARIALIRLYQRFVFRLQPEALKTVPELRVGITLSFKDGLPVTVVPRNR